QTTTRRFRSDELKHFKIPLTLTSCERRFNGDLTVSRQFDEVGIGKVKVVACDAPRKGITKAEREIEAVEARVGKRIQIARPKDSVIEPRLVFNLRHEGARDASNSVGRSLHYGCAEMESAQRIVAELHAVSQFKEAVDETASINACDKNCRIIVISARNEGCRFRLLDCRQRSKTCRKWARQRSDHDGQFRRS